MKLSQYHFDIEFIEGKKNAFADMLSREFLEETGLAINAIRLEDSEVIIEDYKRSWITYDYSERLVDLQDRWRPIQLVTEREGYDHLLKWEELQRQNKEAINSLFYLQRMGCLRYHITSFPGDEGNEIQCIRIIIDYFSNIGWRDGYNPERIKECFFNIMTYQNYACNFFYLIKFSARFSNDDFAALRDIDPMPEWIDEWWIKYSASKWTTEPAELCRMNIESFRVPGSSRQHMLSRRTVEDIVGISDSEFRDRCRCTRQEWIVQNHYVARWVPYQDAQIPDFHHWIDPDLNPYNVLMFVDPPENADAPGWESEKITTVQTFGLRHISAEDYDYPIRQYVDDIFQV